MRSIIIALIVVCLIFAGCRTIILECTQAVVGLRFEGFDSDDLDTVLIRHYAPSTGFATPSRTDTLSFLQRDPIVVNQDGLRAGEDYAVEIPATGTRVTIGDIRLEGPETERVRQSVFRPQERSCINWVVSFRQDDSLVSNELTSDVAAVIEP